MKKLSVVTMLLPLVAGASFAISAVHAEDRKWGEPVNLGHVHKPYTGDDNDAANSDSAPSLNTTVNAGPGTAQVKSTKKKTSNRSRNQANPRSSVSTSVNSGASATSANFEAPATSAESSPVTSTSGNTDTSRPSAAPIYGATGAATSNSSAASDGSVERRPGSTQSGLRNSFKKVGSVLRSEAGRLIDSPSNPYNNNNNNNNNNSYGGTNRGATFGGYNPAENPYRMTGGSPNGNSGFNGIPIRGRAPQADPRDYHVGSGIDSPYNIDRPTHKFGQAPAVSGGYNPAQNYLTPPKPLHQQSNSSSLGAEGALNFASAPRSGGPFNNQRVIALNRAQDWNGLLDYSRAWVAQDPRTPMGWFGLGQSAYKLGNYDAAVAGFLKVTQLTPTEPKPYNNLSAAYCKRAQFDLAAKAVLDGAWYCGKTCTAYDWYVFGNAFKDLNLNEAAEHAYRQALARRSNFPEAQNNLGVVLYNEGDSDSAESWYKKASRGGNKVASANEHSMQEARAEAARAAKAASSGYNMNGADLGFYSPQAVAMRRGQYAMSHGTGSSYRE